METVVTFTHAHFSIFLGKWRGTHDMNYGKCVRPLPSTKISMLNENIVPTVLKLKEQCKVMLTCNLYEISPKLVNGSRGNIDRCMQDLWKSFLRKARLRQPPDGTVLLVGTI